MGAVLTYDIPIDFGVAVFKLVTYGMMFSPVAILIVEQLFKVRTVDHV